MIRFFLETSLNGLKKQKLKIWIKSAIQNEGKIAGDINFIFCDDAYLLEINKKYLNHDYYTDVISFDNSFNKTISGDIYISIDMIKHNSIKNKADFSNEFHRVVIHGILHLIGYNDKSKNQKVQMTTKEDYYLSLCEN